MKKLLLTGIVLAGLGTAQVAQAQAGLVNLVGLGLGMGIRAANGEFKGSPTAPVVTPTTYRASTYPMQRTPKAGLGIIGGDQIAYLERQLNQCHSDLEADSARNVCTAAQLTQLQATQAAIVKAQPKWKMQPYTEEIAFYVAENTRRQPTPALAPATK